MGTGIHQTTQKCPHPQKLIDVQQRPSNVHRIRTNSCVTARGINAINVKAVTECLRNFCLLVLYANCLIPDMFWTPNKICSLLPIKNVHLTERNNESKVFIYFDCIVYCQHSLIIIHNRVPSSVC